MVHSIRSPQKLAPHWSWLGEIADLGLERARAANHPVTGEIGGAAIGARFWIEGASARPAGCVRHRATRRIDDHPVWIVIPEDPRAHRLGFAVPFLRAAKVARNLRHPYVLRTHEAGLLDDGRPYAVVERVPSESFERWIGRVGALPWRDVRPIALRLCSAVEAARQRGIAPRDLDLGTCLHVREGLDDSDVRIGELFVPSSSRPDEQDAPAIAMIVHALLGGDGHTTVADNVLMRALGSNGYPDAGALAEAFAAIEEGAVRRESHGANHAAVAGSLEIDVEAEEAAAAAMPIPKSLADAD